MFRPDTSTRSHRRIARSVPFAIPRFTKLRKVIYRLLMMLRRLKPLLLAAALLLGFVATLTVSSPATAAPGCTTTSSGACIRGGEFCPKASYGQHGFDASGNELVCTGDQTHPKWEPVSSTPAPPPPPAPATCDPFTDVLASSAFCADIQWLNSQGITTGYPDGTFKPAATVQRQEMAAFLYRYAYPGQTPAACTTAPFTDVPTSSPFCGDIAALHTAGVITGYADGGFHPGATVARQETAAFLYRVSNPDEPAAGCTTPTFTDVPTSSPFCGDINYLVSAKVTSGYTDGGFHPTTAVARQEMAAFLHRLYIATR